MENFNLDSDVKVLCVKAKTFPDGIMEAYQKLSALAPSSEGRRYFGISRPEQNGTIVYKAAAEEITEGEAQKLNCEEFVIRSGEYVCLSINNYMNNLKNIGKAFEELIARDDIDPKGYCIEWYLNEKNVRCMVRLKN